MDKQFNLSFEIDDLPGVISNIRRKYQLADYAYDSVCGDRVELQALLGTDAIQFFQKFELV